MESFNKEGRFFGINIEELSVGELLTEDFKVFIHDFTSLEFLVVEVYNSEFEFGDVVEELVFHDLTILSNVSFFLLFFDWNIFSHFKPLAFHFSHDLSGLLVVKLIELIPVCLLPAPSLFLSLLFLLHDDFIPDSFFHNLR